MGTAGFGTSRKTRPLHWIARAVKFVMIVCSAVTVFCLICSTILRYVFNSDWYGVDEIILLFAFWLYFMGSVYGSYEDSHIKADIVSAYVKNVRVRGFITLIAQIVMIGVNLVFLTWAWDYFMWGLERMPRSTALKIPLVIPQSAVFVGLLLMSVYQIAHFAVSVYRYVRFGYIPVPQADATAPENTEEDSGGGNR